MFSLSWHRTSSKPNVNFRLFPFCLTCISFLLGVNCFADFLSSYPFCLLSPLHNHHFTLNDELVICSLNVRSLSNSLKRRETFRWLKMKKMEFFFFKRSTVLKKKNPFGRWSGPSPLFSVTFPVQAPESVYYLTTTFNLK